MSDFQHGDVLLGRSKNYICSGHFVGLIKLMDGTEYAVLQPNPRLPQFSLVYPKTLELYSGSVVYRDRSNEPAERVLPPLSKTSGY